MKPGASTNTAGAAGSSGPPSMSLTARVYLVCVIGLGLLCLLESIFLWRTENPFRFLVYALVCVFASLLKIRLPGIHGTMSVSFFFFLVSIVELTAPETLAMGFLSAFAQTIWRSKSRATSVRALFNVALIAIALRVSYGVFHLHLPDVGLEFPALLMLTACAYFLMNTLPVAIAILLTEGKPLLRTWRETYFWAFPYYLVGAVFAGLFHWLGHGFGWQTAILILPVIYAVYRSYSLYLLKLEAEKLHAITQQAHAEEVSGLHLRTIEALALAIEAKDQTTHDHLQRVQIYSIELGRALGLSEDELQAIRAASLLHDIGKLAVPEHIISKPGRLTPEEFEKMKIHPVVGAEILDHVQFPYPVVPIVRHHHEKWDGTGYPDGLRTEEIPIGARILSAVDCLDALASDRQYRRALPLDDAMAEVTKLAGKSYDPRVVEVLGRNYRQWEAQAKGTTGSSTRKLSTEIKVSRGTPAAGFESSSAPPPAAAANGTGDCEPGQKNTAKPVEFLSSIAAARHEAQILHELTQDMVSYLALDEMLSVVAVRLKKLIPYDTFAVYLKQDDVLAPEFVVGDDFRMFSSLRIPIGQGLAGWVVENRKPLVNGNPSVEPGYLNDPSKFSMLRSALAVPIETGTGVIGVLALYDGRKDAFTQDHLRILLLIASKLAQSIQNGLKYRRAEDTSLTDYLTGLPNARALFLHLGEELNRCESGQTSLAVLVCDLDGFKQVNDRLGHLAGNHLLQEVATNLKKACRARDYVARMGGDEFVVLLPECGQTQIQPFLTRVTASVEAAGTSLEGASQLVSVSIGVAFAPDDAREPEQLLACADRRMYRAKEDGRSVRAVREQLMSAASALVEPAKTLVH